MSHEHVGALLLAAGQSRRMGASNKLLIPINGTPMVRLCAQQLIAAGMAPLVVTGHDRAAIHAALDGLAVTFAHNADFATGQAGSIACGMRAVISRQSTPPVTAMVIALADMPMVTADCVRALCTHHLALADAERHITMPIYQGRRGNPVIWGQIFFEALMQLTGDQGGRQLLGAHKAALNLMEWQDDSIHLDVDTPDAYSQVTQTNYDDQG